MSNLHNSSMIAVAIGATIGVLGAATMLIYQKIVEQRQNAMMNDYVENVDRRFAQLEAELKNVRNQQKNRKSRAITRKRVTSLSSFCTAEDGETDADAMSIAETETADDEFYDCSDEEFGGGDTENGTSRAMKDLRLQLEALDEKMENELLLEEALCDLRSLVIWHDNNVEVISRFGKACFKNANGITDQARQEKLLREGIEVCERVLEMDHADLHKWYALLLGSRTDYLPIKEKLENGMRFEKHVKKALSLRPSDPTLHYLLGRFKYSVAGLSWIERKVCATLFGEVPPATYEEVIRHMEEAERLSEKPDIEYKYYLGMAHLKTKSYKRAMELLHQVNDLPAEKESQESLKNEAKDAITQYSSYS
ncbi:regulator of microtubule dynamics protein 2-like [Venturia canescens]|uniref:regulator of microtubule dynamics protein 2-like n=1 Tax=Venturia canescens TaxID=32260 RepID=UPI001C9BE1CB|nr:regulator of microtubule dynamics protein 2-like [Venturia canescens]